MIGIVSRDFISSKYRDRVQETSKNQLDSNTIGVIVFFGTVPMISCVPVSGVIPGEMKCGKYLFQSVHN